MKILIWTDDRNPFPLTYDLGGNAAVPNTGDTVMLRGGIKLEVYERVFDFELHPDEVTLRCRFKEEQQIQVRPSGPNASESSAQ